MLRPASVVLVPLFIAASTAALRAQDHGLAPAGGDRLGTVHFQTSCTESVAPRFDRGIALLHSFEFAASMREFEGVLVADSTCAMAWWGIALGRWGNPMVPNLRPAPALLRGWEAVEAARRVADGATDRERDYIAAVSQLYEDPGKDQRVRQVAYEEAMAALAAKHPDDTEARVFHAISIVGTASPSDKTYSNQLRAGAMLEELFRQNPDHPGLAHYIIHSYDVPALAERASAAAERYADIAPAAAHALHMPSHTFTRVGMWDQSIRTNLRSMEVAEQQASLAEALHAADYAVYAYLQLGQDSAAFNIVRRLPELAAKFDPSAVTGAAPGSAGIFALAAMPARYALERGAREEATRLTAAASAYPYAEAMTWFAKALGAARSRDVAAAGEAVDSLAAIQARLAQSGESYWAEQVAIQQLGASAWLDLAIGRGEQALERMREAATREAATEKSAVSPGPLAPARELLGDMLLELGRPDEALTEYRASLEREPNRRRSVEGISRIERTP
jgi:tetratricopeptide (TPR) repeat protein